jgi:hypothetical protein
MSTFEAGPIYPRDEIGSEVRKYLEANDAQKLLKYLRNI